MIESRIRRLEKENRSLRFQLVVVGLLSAGVWASQSSPSATASARSPREDSQLVALASTLSSDASPPASPTAPELLEWDASVGKLIIPQYPFDGLFKGITVGRKNSSNANLFFQVGHEFNMAGQPSHSRLADFDLYLKGDGAGKTFDGLYSLVHTNLGNVGGVHEIKAAGFYARNENASGVIDRLYGSESAATSSNLAATSLVVGALNQAQVSSLDLGGKASGSVGIAIGTDTTAVVRPESSPGATMAVAKGIEASVEQNGPKGTTIREGYAVDAQCALGGAGNIETFGGLLVRDASKTSTGGITRSNYGVRILAQTAGRQNNYGLWIGGASGGIRMNQALHIEAGESYFGGGQRVKRVPLNADYDVSADDYYLACRKGGIAITLPSARGSAGRVYIVKDESGSAGHRHVRILTTGAETIDGTHSISIDTDFGAQRLISDGSNWFTM